MSLETLFQLVSNSNAITEDLKKDATKNAQKGNLHHILCCTTFRYL